MKASLAPDIAMGTRISFAVITNAVLFQIGWFACVVGAGRGYPWLGTGKAIAVVAFHLSRARAPLTELKLIACALGIGLVWDGILATTGVVAYASGVIMPGLPPHWILALWALFATTLNSSLAWLRRRLILATVLGAIAGPLSYWAGVRLGALGIPSPPMALATLALGWALLVPLLLVLARRYDGVFAQ